MVLPKEIRQQMGLRADEKLAVMLWKQGTRTCCVSLHRAEDLAEAARSAFGPLLREIVRG